MFPRLLSIGPFTLYSYGVMMALAFVAGLTLTWVRAGSRGLDRQRVIDLGIVVILAAMIGAKALLIVVDGDAIIRDPSQLFSLARTGGVFYGGLIAAVAAALWYLHRHRLPLWRTCDVFAPGIALGHVLGRIGCLLAGCCYGRPADVAWSVQFHDEFAHGFVGTPLGVALHPTQLYEAGAEALILGVLLVQERRGEDFAGRTIWTYLALYAVSRFAIEFFRGDPRGALGPLSTSQIISLVLLPLSLVALVRLSRQAQRSRRPHGTPSVHR